MCVWKLEGKFECCFLGSVHHFFELPSLTGLELIP